MAHHGTGERTTVITWPDLSWRPGTGAGAGVLGLAAAAALWFANKRVLRLPGWSVNEGWTEGTRYPSAVVLHWSPIAVLVLALALWVKAVRPFAGAALLVLGVFGFAAVLELTIEISNGEGMTHGVGLSLHLLAALVVLAAGIAGSAGTMSEPIVPRRGRAGQYLGYIAVALSFLSVLGVAWQNLGSGQVLQSLPFVATALAYPIMFSVLTRCLRTMDYLSAAGALTCAGVVTGLPPVYWLSSGARFFQPDSLDANYLDAIILVSLLLIAAGLAQFVEAVRAIGPQSASPSGPDAGAEDGLPVVDVRESSLVLSPDRQTTRHLCVAMQVDDELVRRAAREVIDNPARGIAPSFGVDLGPVVRHALVARRRIQIRDAVLAALALESVIEMLCFMVTKNPVILESLGLSAVLGWVVVGGHRAVREWSLSQRLSPEAFGRNQSPRLSDAEERKVTALQALDRGNVTAYGGYFPFVGSGSAIGGWSFALSVLKGREGLDGRRQAPRPFELAELYEAVRTEVDKLGIEGVHVEDRLYVDGEGIETDPRFSTGGATAPQVIGFIPPSTLSDLIRTPERVNRVYRCIRIYGWGGEYVLSIYLNFTRTGRGLFAQARYFLLLPAKREYLDAEPPAGHLTPERLVGIGYRSLKQTAPALIGAIPHALRDLRDASARTAGSGPSLGATTSLRELAQSRQYRRYFQQLDQEMTSKIVERQLLDTITEFLRDRNIDTFEVEERQTAILNNGLIVSGGTVNAESLAVGVNSQSLLSRVGAAIKTVTEEKSAS